MDYLKIATDLARTAAAEARSKPSPAEVIGKARRLRNLLGAIAQGLDEAHAIMPALVRNVAACEALATELAEDAEGALR